MAFDRRRTYLCYNNKDLIRDGFIPRFIRKSYREDNSLTNPVTTFNFNRLRNPPKGVTYTVVRSETDPSIIVEVIEKKKLLPAEKIKIEIEFGKTMKNAVSHPIGPGPLVPGTVGGLIGNVGLGAIGFGGFTTGFTEMTYHLLESGTKVNQKVVITQEILDTSIIQFDGFPLTIFGIVKEHTEPIAATADSDAEADKAVFKEAHPQARFRIINDGQDIEAYIGLDFQTNEDFNQLDSLGKFSSGSFLGTGRKRIDGATDSDGLFGGRANPYLIIVGSAGDSGLEATSAKKREVILFSNQKQLFVKIVDDDRTLKFRGDNREALGGGEYPFSIRGTTGIDVTDRQIRIDTTDLVVGDVIYITHNTTVGDRHLRQNVEHKGTIGQGNTVGVIGFMAAVDSKQDIFDYKIKKWKVPSLPNGITMPIIDQVTDGYTEDDDYKLTLNEFINIDAQQREEELVLTGDEATVIEGWRLSEAILWRRIDDLFAADFRGIIHIKNRSRVSILYPRSLIRDQDWFTRYLESLPFTFPTGPPDPADPVDENGNPKNTYLPTDLEKTLESETNFDNMEGFLFDSSEIVNSLFFDREKLHYYRPFADALKIISPYVEDDLATGVGIPHLDLLSLLCSSVTTRITGIEVIGGETITRRIHSYDNFDHTTCSPINLEYYDLSYSVFDNTHAATSKSRSCEDPFPLRHFNYFSTNRDANSEGQSIWYDVGFINSSVQEWRPEGGTLNSHWKLETPYFCSDFNSSTRVYIEKMGGNSLDNYSWIYVDTEAFVPNNISADANYDASSSVVVFSDDVMHNSLSYYRMNDNYFERQLALKKIDKTKNHIRDTYAHVVDGQNVTEAYDHDQNFLVGQNRLLGDSPSYSYGVPVVEDVFKPGSEDFSTFFFTRDLETDTWDDGTSFDLNFSDNPPRASIPSNWSVESIEIEFSYISEVVKGIERYVSFYFEDTESSVSDFLMSEINPKEEGSDVFVVKLNFGYYFGGPLQFLGKFWEKVNINDIKARFVKGGDLNVEEKFNLDTYKITSGQSSVSFDRQGRILVFYANEETSNIDIAISNDDGNTWIYDRNIIRLISGETATMPFVIKDTNTQYVHLFWVLNDKFLMYRQVDTNDVQIVSNFVEPIIPDTYEAGDYDITLDDPERDYWGDYTFNGLSLRRESSYFVVANASDEYFLEQTQIVKQISESNNSLIGTDDSNKIQTLRFIPASNPLEMRDNFNGSPYSTYLSDDGILRLLFTSNNRLSIKSSGNHVSWKYDVFEQSIHKNYMDEELNKGFTEDISNVQIVRDDYDKSTVSVLYFHNGMLFIRHFYTNKLFTWNDSEGSSHDQFIRNHLEVTDEDLTAEPPKNRTAHVPIFLVGVIPERIRNSIKDDIENDVSIEDSDLAIFFPYKDPDNPSDKNDNKAMVDIFNEDFAVDTNTQPYSFVTAKGLIRVFYRDSIGNINGIIIDSLIDPNLEVMNVFNSV